MHALSILKNEHLQADDHSEIFPYFTFINSLKISGNLLSRDSSSDRRNQTLQNHNSQNSLLLFELFE